MKKVKRLLLVLPITLLLMSSCMMTKTSVGTYKESVGKEYTYDKGKQMWLFWGVLPIGRTDVSTPVNGSCEVITKFKFTDLLISGLTGGIVTSYSIKVKAKKQE